MDIAQSAALVAGAEHQLAMELLGPLTNNDRLGISLCELETKEMAGVDAAAQALIGHCFVEARDRIGAILPRERQNEWLDGYEGQFPQTEAARRAARAGEVSINKNPRTHARRRV